MSPQPDDSTHGRSTTQTTGDSHQRQSYILPARVYDQPNPDGKRHQRDIQQNSDSVNRSSANANRKTKMVGGILHQPQGREISGTSQDVWFQLHKNPLHGTPASYNWDEDDDTRKSNQSGLGGSTSPSSPKSTRSANSWLGRLLTKSTRDLRNAFKKDK